MLIAAALAAGLLLAQAAADPATAPATAATAVAAKPEMPKKPTLICTDETPVGSVISKRTCRTPQQAETDQAAARRATDRLMDRLATCSAASC